MNFSALQAWAARRTLRFWIPAAVVAAFVLVVAALPRQQSSDARTAPAKLRGATSSTSPTAGTSSAAQAQAAAASRAALASQSAVASRSAASRSAAARSASSAAASAAASQSAASASRSAAAQPPAPAEDCGGYDPCIPSGPDVDCAGGKGNGPRYVQGPVTVTGSDPYGLDRDGDGIGCE